VKLGFLAENIQTRLDEQKISVSEFERLAGLKRSVVANILTGKSKNPTIEVVISIANRLGCSIEELLDTGFPESKGTRSVNVNPKDSEESQLFFEIGHLLLNKLKSLDIFPSYTNFTNCFKEIFFYATHGHKDRFKEDDFLFWIIKSHFPDGEKK
jgi:transcriptional regulator with XRE-family HTH domain